MSEPSTVTIDSTRFASLADMRDRATEALGQWNTAKATAKDKHQAYENARETFEREFDRLVKTTRGEDLPLFQSMADAVDAAKSDPVVTKLVDRLLAHGHEVNALIVHGYTEDERNQVAAYLDAVDRNDERRAAVEDSVVSPLEEVEVPAFLVPQHFTAIEKADLLRRLSEAGHDVDPLVLPGWALSLVSRREVFGYLEAVERIKAAKGEALTMDDLPPAPQCVLEAETQDVDEDGDDEREAGETDTRAEA